MPSSYGETAYQTFARLTGADLSFDQLSEQTKNHWENTAAAVIVEFRKRQAELSRQTPKPE